MPLVLSAGRIYAVASFCWPFFPPWYTRGTRTFHFLFLLLVAYSFVCFFFIFIMRLYALLFCFKRRGRSNSGSPPFCRLGSRRSRARVCFLSQSFP